MRCTRPTDEPVLAALAGALVVATAFGAARLSEGEMIAFAWSLLVHGAVYLAGLWWVLRRDPTPRDLALILVAAVLMRGLAATAPITLTTDVLRYVWDGRVQAAGFNPYLLVPADPRLADLQGWVHFPSINQKDTAVTIYPPTAELIFLAATRIIDGTEGLRLAMIACEAVTTWAILRWLAADGLPRERVIVYAWHPLPIWELSSQAHIDSAAIALLMLAVLAARNGWQGRAGTVMAAAALTKYFPVVLIPALWRRGGWHMPAAFVATAVVLYLPYWIGAGSGVVGFLGSHLDNEGYRAGYGFHLIWMLRDMSWPSPSAAAYVAASLALLGVLGLVALVRRAPDGIRPEHLVMLAFAFTWLTSPHYPWYFAWIVPLSCRHLSPAALAMTLASLIHYMPYDGLQLTHTQHYLIVFGLPLAIGLAGWLARHGRHRRGG